MENQSYKFNRIVANIFFTFALFPFVSPFPINADVQPLAAVVALFVYFSSAFSSGRISLKLGFIILLTFLSCLYLNPLGQVDLQLGKILALFVGLVTLLFTYQYHKFFSAQLFSLVIKVYFSISILFLIFPNAVVSFQSLIVRKMNVTEFGYRGISTLSTEPGLFGGLLVGMLALNIYFFRTQKLSLKHFIVNVLLLLTMVLLTKSGSGYMYFLVFIVTLFISKLDMKKLLASSLIVIILLTSSLSSITNKTSDFAKLGRGFQTFSNLVSNPELLFRDRSIVYRLYAVYVACLSFAEKPFGVGHGSVKSVSQKIVDEDAKLNYFYSSYNEDFHPVSSFGFYLTAYGIFFLALMCILLVSLRPTLPFLSLALIYLFFSYSFAFPMIWILSVVGGRYMRGKNV